MQKLVIISTHPIQYYAPVFRLLALKYDLMVFYTWGKGSQEDKYDPDFGKKISWDIPLLEGYKYEFLKNNSKNPGSDSFKGIQNPDLVTRIIAFNPDAILVYGWAYQSHLKVMRYFKGKIPVWFRGDSNLLDEQGILKRIARNILLHWVYFQVDLAFYVGTANKAYFKHYGLKEKQLVFAPHAVDNDRFAENRYTEALALRKSLNIPDDALLLLFAGKLEPKKDPELLLQAFININHPNAYLLIVGNGILEEKLKQQARSQTLNAKIRFLSFQNQSQMPVIYQACDLFCLPSRGPGETWGLAVNEAMAAGKPVLVSDRVGCSVDLVNSSTGSIFKSGDLHALCSKLMAILNQDLKTMGQAAKNKISNWSVEKQASAIYHASQKN